MRFLLSLAAGILLLASSTAAAPAHTIPSVLPTYSGALYDGEIGTLDLVLQPGTRYTYDGLCDLYCSDLDFALYEWVPPYNGRRGYWRFVVADRGWDDTPGIWVEPVLRTTYRLSIIMSDCSSGPCDYDVDVTW